MNPFVNSRPSLSQIESTPSSQDGISAESEDLLRSYGTKLIQSCGILLKLYRLVVLAHTADLKARLLQRWCYFNNSTM